MPNDSTVSAKAAFYLQHRAAIEQWGRLRADAAAEVNAALEDLRERLDRVAADQGAQVLPVEGDAQLILTKHTWARPRRNVYVAAGWDANKLLTPGPGTDYKWAWVGIYATGPGTQKLAEFLQDKLKRSRPELTFAEDWIAWRPVYPAGGPDAACTPQEYADEVLKALKKLWPVASAALDAYLVTAKQLPADGITSGRPV